MAAMNWDGEPLVTVAVVPRETLSRTLTTLRSILAAARDDDAAQPFRLLCVDGGSAPALADELARFARTHGITLLRSEAWLTPNEARNLAWAEARTRYVVFVDNDVQVGRGWLDALVDAAERGSAALVGPLYLIGEPGPRTIHMAGGDLRLIGIDGRRGLHETHRFGNRPLDEVAHELRAGPTESVEFHVALVRRDLRDRLGPLDEGLRSSHEHLDLCLRVQALGEPILFEPASVVTYVPPPPFTGDDRRYFLMRWCRRWSRDGDARMAGRWGLTDRRWLRASARWYERHRWMAYGRPPVNRRARRRGMRALATLERLAFRALDRVVEWLVVNPDLRRREAARALPVQVVCEGRVLGERAARRELAVTP